MKKLLTLSFQLSISLWLMLCLTSASFAQGTHSPAVAAAAAPEQARFLADNEVVNIRLEVFSFGNTRLYDSDFKAGNLLDWHWQDQQGQRLPDGTYRCVITVKDLAGHLAQRQGVLLIQNSEANWQAPEQAEAALRNTAAATSMPFFTPVTNPSELAVAVLAHDGNDARLMTGSGGLSVRSGNFLKGDEQERMKLHADGKLEVKGLIQTTEGIVFPDGTMQRTAYVASGQTLKQIAEDGKPVKLSPNAPAVGGSGTPNRLMKWAANGVDATDSSVTDNGPGGGITVNGGVQSTFYEASASGTFLSFKPAIAGSAFLLRSNSLSGNIWIGHLGNVGLNASEPASRFATGGNATVGASYYGTAAPANGLLVQGNVGIGTTAPAAALHVNNGIFILSPDSNREISLGTPNGEAGSAIKNAGNRADVRFDGGTLKLVAGTGLGPPGSTNGINIKTDGNVGIGTASPTTKLDVRQTGSGTSVFGESNSGIGVYGSSDSSSGVSGRSISSAGVLGNSTSGSGVSGYSSDGDGVSGGSGFGFGGYFYGKVHVNGTLSKAAGSFKIDHPLDPENKYLSHSFVESPEMKNIYDGTVTTDAQGEATVTLPAWFEALNKDFRYQLTVIGQFAQAIVAAKIKDNRFKIKTSLPDVEVSWQVTGVRQDAYANQHRIPIEEDKPEQERGSYLHPQGFNQPEEKGVEWRRQPAMMQRIKADRLKRAAESGPTATDKATPGKP